MAERQGLSTVGGTAVGFEDSGVGFAVSGPRVARKAYLSFHASWPATDAGQTSR
jgi:hypothetical protein